MNTIYYGDNLPILKKYIKDESVDLVYLDPPFNSKKQYNIIYKETENKMSQAQSLAFDDTWSWTKETQKTFEELIVNSNPDVVSAIKAFYSMFGKADITAYLVMLASRVVELYRILKPTGSIYIHCDPTASHYIKIIMDAIFGTENFQNEIVWYYQTGGASKKRYSRKHDIILFYTKGEDWIFNSNDIQIRRSEKSIKRAQFANARTAADDVYKNPDDVFLIKAMNPMSKERTGYPTQKPLALLEKIIKASCPKDGIVLDPFCGCGTSLVAAQKLERKWIGIDITYLAINVLQQRFHDEFPAIRAGEHYKIEGDPEDMYAAKKLSKQEHQFAIWAITKIGGKPNKKKSGDKGIDGFYDFLDNDIPKRGLIQVTKEKRGGGPKKMRDFCHVVKRDNAALGIFITLDEPTKDMKTEAIGEGFYTTKLNEKYPKIQIITIEELLSKNSIKKLNIPSPKRQ